MASLGLLWLLAALISLSTADYKPPKLETYPLVGTPADWCSLTFPTLNYAVDLCPLLSRPSAQFGNITREVLTPPSRTRTTYRWSLSGPLPRDGTLDAAHQCPEGTYICKTVKNRLTAQPSLPPRITEVIPIAGVLKASSNHSEHKGHEDEDVILLNTELRPMTTLYAYSDSTYRIAIILRGGSYVQKPQQALFLFDCDAKGSHEDSSPKSAYASNGTHIFFWKTPHACGRMLAVPASTIAATPRPTGGAGDDKTGEGAQKPPIDDEGNDGNPEAWHPLAPSRPRDRMLGALSGALFTLVLLGALLFALRMRGSALGKRLGASKARVSRAVNGVLKRHPLAPLYRRMTFRVGEGTLLGWAREGYVGVPGDGDGALSFNANEEGEWMEGQRDEMIPLAPSPRSKEFGRGVKVYGTAQ